MELVLDAAREASEATGVGIGVVIAANRTRHPLDAKTLARLAVQYAGKGVVGFGLSNDERRGRAYDFEGRSGSPSAAGSCRIRTAASCWARRASGSAWRRWMPTGSGTASARSRTRGCWSGSWSGA